MNPPDKSKPVASPAVAALRPDARHWIRHGLFLLLLAAVLGIAGCNSGGGDESDAAEKQLEQSNNPGDGEPPTSADAGGGTVSGLFWSVGLSLPSNAPSGPVLADLGVSDFVVVSTRRIGRTTMEYVLRLKVSNSGSERYQNAVATLVSVPAHIVVVDGVAVIGNIPPNSTVLSQDTFTVNINLLISTSFDDFVWRLDADVIAPPPPPPPGPRPTQTGIFMNIDDLAIPGESTSESHRDWIQLSNVMDGLHREGLAGGGASRARSRFVFDGLQAMKEFDRSTPKLREAIADGRIFGEVKIDIIRRCGDNPYTAFAITLSIARLEGLNAQGTADARPVEELAFNYSRIETMYTPVEDDCSLGTPVYSTQDGDLLEL